MRASKLQWASLMDNRKNHGTLGSRGVHAISAYKQPFCASQAGSPNE